MSKHHPEEGPRQSARYPFIAEHRGGPLTKKHHRLLMKWALECAGHVLSLAGNNIDHRLTEALTLAEEWENCRIAAGVCMKASQEAHAAARETDDPVRKAIARSVGQAAATAHMADHSLGGAFYALRAVKLAHADVQREKEWQYQKLAGFPDPIAKIVHTLWQQKDLDKKIESNRK